jgi:general secretion pathway protein L
MREQLFIRLDHNASVEAAWLRVAETGSDEETVFSEKIQESAQGSLEQAALEATGCRVIVLIPGVDVLLTSAVVPSRNRQRILSAIPYMLEEQLAEDVDTLHFAIGKRDQDGRISTAVIDRGRMDDCLQRLRNVGIEPDLIIPETLALPFEPGNWTLLKGPDVTLVRTGVQSAFALDSDNLDTLLPMALTENDDNMPHQIRWIECTMDDNSFPLDLSQFEVGVNAETYPGTTLEFFARYFKEQEAINLLQGAYSRREQLGRIWRPWRPAMAMGVLLLLLHGGLTISDYISLRKERQMLTERIDKIYLDTFPGSHRVVNPKAQMQEGLRSLRGDTTRVAGGFLDLLAGSGASLSQTNGLELQRISYRDGQLDLAIVIRDLQSLDQLKQQLASKSGYNVEIQSATARGNSVEARLQLKSNES